MPADGFCLQFCSLSLLLFKTTFVVLDPSTKEWCKNQLERFSVLKDFRVYRRKMKKSDEFGRNLNLGLFFRNAPATLQSTLKVPGESLSEGEPI